MQATSTRFDIPDMVISRPNRQVARSVAEACQRSQYPAAQRSSNPPLGPEDPVYSIAPPCARRCPLMS